MTTTPHPFTRPSGRAAAELRPITIELAVQRNALGSALVSTGHTRVLCAASVEERLPAWLKGQDRGWVTGEYGMLPGSGSDRIPRRQSGRGTEIQRLIGRSLRAATDLSALPGLTVTLDCDVLDADGGTRTASITGAWIALYQACRELLDTGRLPRMPLTDQIAAVSVGIVAGQPLLDLDYTEDQTAEVDLNVVATSGGRLVEIQGTAEGQPFTRHQLDRMLDLALTGIERLLRAQREAVGLDPDTPFGDHLE
jgi:ribonuclease PH